MRRLDLKIPVTPQEKISPGRQQRWENLYGSKTWQARLSWFQKPLAMQLSPFEESIWLDLDCEILKPLDPLFALLAQGDIAACPYSKKSYNSGVVVYRKEASLLTAWAEGCRHDNHRFIGDDHLLSHLIKKAWPGFVPLPNLYNWTGYFGFNPEATIIHWHNEWGKMFIELYGGAQGFQSYLNPRASQAEQNSL